MSELFDSWSDEQINSLITYMMNSNVNPDDYNEIEAIMNEVISEAVERGLIQE